MANEQRRKLYNAINQAGYDIGDYDDFDRRMNNPEDRKKFFQAVNDAGYDIGSEEDFERRISPSKYKLKTGGKYIPVGEREYKDFVSRKSGSQKPSQPTATPNPAPSAPLPGKPWGARQVRTTTPASGVSDRAPFRKNLTAAERAEIERNNDYAARQVDKFREGRKREDARRNTPIATTGNKSADRYVVKTQGQYEDEVERGIHDIGSRYVSPVVQKAMQDMDDQWYATMGEAGSAPMGEGGEIAALRRANERVDPDKVLEGLRQRLGSIYSNPDMQRDIEEKARKAGIPKDEYVSRFVEPAMKEQLESDFASSMIAKSLPKNATEYIIQGLGDSIGGMLMGSSVETKGQRAYRNQADAMTEEGGNPYYTPGTGARLTKMGVSFAADAPFFGVYGKVSGSVVKNVAERQIKNMMAKGLSEGAARSIVGTALENSVGARMKNYLMQHVVSSSLTMGAYNATSETARQLRDKEGIDIGSIASSTGEGLATGAAFGVTGGVSQALSQPLSGIRKVGAKIAGFGAEAETMYATEELAKMAHGEEGFTNPFEGSVEAVMKLGVMKLSSPEGLTKAIGEVVHPVKSNRRQQTGVHFSKEEEGYIRNSAEGKNLLDALSGMHPELAVSEVNGKKKLTKEGEQMRRALSDSYNSFMENAEIPATVKQKVAGVLGGIYHPGLETGADILHNADGSVVVKTRDKDGNCIRDIKFDSFDEARQWQDSQKSQFSRNDAVDMWNNASGETRQKIVDAVKDEVSGRNALEGKRAEIEDQLTKATGLKQKRLQRQLAAINQMNEEYRKLEEGYEGREMTDEEARNFIQTVIRDGSDEVFDGMYGLISGIAHPADEYNPQRRYQEGRRMSAEERHMAKADLQLQEERLLLIGDDFAREVTDNADYADEKMAELAGRRDISGEQLEAARDYYNAKARLDGALDETIKGVDEQVEEANATIRRNTHPGSGSLIEASYDGRSHYVTAGHFQVTPDGRIEPTDDSGVVILRDKETGDISVVNPRDVLVTAINDPRRMIEANDSMDGLRGELMRQAEEVIELHPDTPDTPQSGDSFTGEDGQRYAVMEMQDDQGNPVWMKVAVDDGGNMTGEPQPLDLGEYRRAKSDEMDRAERPQTEQPPVEQDTPPAGEAAPLIDDLENRLQDTDTETAGNYAQKGVENIPEQGNNGVGNIPDSRIPVDDKGKKIYEQAKPEDTLSELTEKYGEEKARQFIAKMAENTARALDELSRKDTSKMTDANDLEAYNDELSELQKKADYWKGLIKPEETKVEKAMANNRPVLSDETNEYGKKSVVSGDGSTIFGEITHESGLTPAPIKLSEGESRNKKEVQSLPTIGSDANADTTGVNHGQSDGATVTSENSPSTSDGKDTKNTDTVQENQKKNDVSRQPAPVQPVEPVSPSANDQQQPRQTEAQRKVYEGSVRNNVGRTFEFTDKSGKRTEITITGMTPDGQAEVRRRDFDAQGSPLGEERVQQFPASRIGEGIVNGTWKRAMTDGERLRDAYKGRMGMENLIETLGDDEASALWAAHERARTEDGEAAKADLSEMLNDLQHRHAEDIVDNRRQRRVAEAEKALSGGSFNEKLRKLKRAYQGVAGIDDVLGDHALEPVTIEEYAAAHLGDVPKAGAGFIDHESLAAETGHGLRRIGGDSRAYSSYLAPKGKGKSIKQVAHEMWQDLDERLHNEWSDQDCLNALIEVLTSGEKPSDIAGYILRNRQRQAEELARHEEEADLAAFHSGEIKFQKVVRERFRDRLDSAIADTDTEPTEAQKEAGNYRKGHISFGGYDLTIENPAGSIRRGTDSDGRQWEQKMNNTYGYILGKYGKDGDHLDMFINDDADLDRWNGNVYVIDQVDPKTGKFDEHKIVFGYDSEAEAREAYLSNYEEGWQGLGKITGVSKETFDKWLESSDRKIKEFSDHSIVKEAAHKVEGELLSPVPEQEAALRDAVVDHLRSLGVEVSTDWKEGQRILDEYNGNGPIKKMGTTTNNRMSDVATQFADKQLTDQQSVIASVYTGEKDNQTATFKREDGSVVRMKFQQGEDTKAGTKHSLFAHYGTTKGVISADDILRIPDVIEKGNRKQKGKNVEYTLKDGKTTYTVYAKVKGGIEVFQDFYSSWKIKNKETSASKPSITQGENTQSAQSDDANVSSGAKVQQNPETAKDSERKFFRTPDGHAYGYTYKGKIYIDPRIATAETPVHEYGHLWCEMKRSTAPEEWGQMKEVMLNDKLVQPIIERVKRDYPELAKEGREDEFIEEIITQFSGKRGSERLKEMADEIAAENGGVFGKAEAVTAMQRLKNVLNRFWEGVARMMGWKYRTADQIADRMMADMLGGVNPTESMKEAAGERKGFAAEHGIDESLIREYEEGINTENLAKAARAFTEIRRTLRMANKDKKLSEFTELFTPIKEGLFNHYGSIDALREKQSREAEIRAGVMEAARKREEEARARERDRLKELEDMTDEQLDDAYMKALEANDENRMRDIIDVMGDRRGYTDDSDYQGEGAWKAPGNPGYESDEARRADVETNSPDVNVTDIAKGFSPQPSDYFLNPRAYGYDNSHGRESANAITKAMAKIANGGKNVKVKVYRAVPENVEEGTFRNGDWVTPSREYAEMHGKNRLEGKYRIIEQEVPADQLWWDGNDVNEWGYDDGSGYRYRNTENSRKLNDLVTRDDEGNVIPPSRRFDEASPDVRFQKIEGDTHSDNFKNFFGDWEKDPENASKIVDSEGEPMVVYHQTANDFTVFDPRHKGSGTNDYQLPFGIFMKPTARNIGLGGEKQMPLYANIRKPLRVENRQVLSALLKSKVEGYKEALAEYEKIDRDYSKKFDEAMKFDHDRDVENWNKWKAGEMTEEEYQNAVSDTAEDVINQWKEAQGKPISEMKELLDNYFRNSEYDGIWIARDEGSMGRSTETIIAFEPNQVKSATDNTGTYDPGNPDIRFQRVGSPEPEMTPEERQYWKKWEGAMKKWRERNGLSADAEAPAERPRYRQGESAMDYAKRVTGYMRERALWETAPKLEDYRQARDDKAVADEAREAEKAGPDLFRNNKALRAAADMARIRHAMARQKAYDKATVKAVTDFAQDFMRQGFGDNLGRGDIERLLSSVKNATGGRNVKKEIDNIQDILVDNFLRNLENSVVKLSGVKELRQTAQGVEKQGKLELKGQRMIQEFRKAREGRLTAEQIRERMSDVLEKMSANDGQAPMREQEYEGLSTALQYVEGVDASRQEYAALEKEYDDAVKDYKQSGRYPQEQQQLLESLDEAMQENKIERIGLYGDLIGRLQGNISESVKGAREFVEREKQRVSHIHEMANKDLAGVSFRNSRKETKTDRLLQNDITRLVLSPLGTFEQFLKQFGSRDSRGVGYLHDYYIRGFMDAQNNAYAGMSKAREEMDAKAREVFGDKVKHWSDLYNISRQPGMDLEYLDGGERVRENLSQGNMLYIYMADKMSDGRMKLRKMGIDEEKVKQVKEKIDPRLIQLGDWLQSEYLRQKRVEYNKVHERMFGAPMAAIDNYFPIKVNRDAVYQDAEKYMMSKEGDKLPSSITGSIIKRTVNALPLDILHTDALSLAMEHIEQMEQWKAQAEWNRDVKDLLSYTAFRNKVKNMKTIYGSGSQLWNDFFDAATIATGDYVPKRGAADKALTNIAKGITGAKINFRIYTAFKQLQSIQAFVTDVPVSDLAKAMMPQNYFHNNFVWAKENIPVFRKRWESRQIGDTRLMDDPTDWKIWKKKWMQEITKYGMYSNAAIDALTCAAGAKATYDSKYRKYKEIGASDEVARKRALQDAAIAYNLTQQSSEGAFVSAIQKDRTLTANALTVFRNGPFSYTRQAVDAIRNFKHVTQKGYREDSIRFTAGRLRDELGIDEAQAEKAAELQYAHTVRHEVAKVLNMMFGITITWNLLQSVPYLIFGDDGSHIDAAKDMLKGNFRKAYDEFSGSTKGQMWADAIAKGIAGGPVEGLAAGNIWSDIMGTALSEQTRRTFSEQGLGAAFDEALKQAGDYEVNPLPMMADIQSLIDKMGYDKYAAAQDLFNLVAQSYTGVNPQTFTDMWNAVIDYGNPSWMPLVDKDKHNSDLSNSKEIALFIMRVLNAPTKSWRNTYIDELGMNAEDAKKLPYEEMARRYANYKHWKDAPIMGWLRGEEVRQKKMETIRKQFDKAVDDRIARLTDDELKSNLARSKSIEEKRRYAKLIHSRLGGNGKDAGNAKEEWQREYQGLMQYDDIREDEELSARKKAARDRGDTKTVKAIEKLEDRIRDKGKKMLGKGDDDSELMGKIRQWRAEALEIALKAEPQQGGSEGGYDKGGVFRYDDVEDAPMDGFPGQQARSKKDLR